MINFTKLKIALIEDHLLVRQSLKQYLISAGHEITAEANNLMQIYDTIVKSAPDLILMDFKLSDGDTLEIANRIKSDMKKIKVIMVTGINSASALKQINESEVDGLFLKEGIIEELMKAIETVMSGQRYISPLVEPYLDEASICLTPREIQILNLIIMGLPRKDIAFQLNISPETIKSHRKNIMRKLDVNNVTALILKAKELKLLDY
ncbi:MAG: response regulator transcription factor [Gammaproteobacteria bacterium]|nr:response regulator transcription factor [Gammaproteobacteria bacterium]